MGVGCILVWIILYIISIRIWRDSVRIEWGWYNEICVRGYLWEIYLVGGDYKYYGRGWFY